MNWQFQYKEFIWLWPALAALSLLFLLLLFWKRKVRNRIGEERLVSRLTRNHSSRRFFLKFLFLALAFASGILAVMNPRRPGGSDSIKREGIDIAIAMDVSKSMLAADLAPDRLDRAKQFIHKLVNEMPDDRFALILFAGKAYMQMPLTSDHGAMDLFVSSSGPDAVPQQGTVISDALQMSAKVFNSEEKRFKTIVLITDGEDHDENAEKTAEQLAEQGVMINTIGIGSPEGAVIMDPSTGKIKTDAEGNNVISKLNEDLLRGIAGKTNGIYLRLQNSDEEVTALKSQLAQIDRKAFGDVSLMSFRSYYIWFAGLMFLLLFTENFIPERKPVRKKEKINPA